jgi:hypothetical protein
MFISPTLKGSYKYATPYLNSKQRINMQVAILNDEGKEVKDQT